MTAAEFKHIVAINRSNAPALAKWKFVDRRGDEHVITVELDDLIIGGQGASVFITESVRVEVPLRELTAR